MFHPDYFLDLPTGSSRRCAFDLAGRVSCASRRFERDTRDGRCPDSLLTPYAMVSGIGVQRGTAPGPGIPVWSPPRDRFACVRYHRAGSSIGSDNRG